MVMTLTAEIRVHGTSVMALLLQKQTPKHMQTYMRVVAETRSWEMQPTNPILASPQTSLGDIEREGRFVNMVKSNE